MVGFLGKLARELQEKHPHLTRKERRELAKMQEILKDKQSTRPQTESAE